MGGLFSLSLNLTLEALPGKGVVLIEVVHGIRCLDGEGVEVFVVVDVDRLNRGGKRRNWHLYGIAGHHRLLPNTTIWFLLFAMFIVEYRPGLRMAD